MKTSRRFKIGGVLAIVAFAASVLGIASFSGEQIPSTPFSQSASDSKWRGNSQPYPMWVQQLGGTGSIKAGAVQTIAASDATEVVTLPTCSTGYQWVQVCGWDTDTVVARVSFNAVDAAADGVPITKRGESTSCADSGPLTAVTQAQASTDCSGCTGPYDLVAIVGCKP